MVAFENEGTPVFRNWAKNEANVHLTTFMSIFFHI